MSPHLIINGWFWGQSTTGSGQYLHGLLRHLPAALPGWQITMLVPEKHGSSDLPPAPCSLLPIPFPSFAFGARLSKLAWEQWTFPRQCAQLNADVAFIPFWGSPLQSPCPCIVTIHDLIPLLLDDYATKLTARAYTRLVSKSARSAAAVLTVSQSAHDDIVEHLGIPAQRVHVTYEGLGVPHAPVTDPAELERVRRTYNLPERYLFYLGGFDPRKNVPLLIRAYARARQLWSDSEIRLRQNMPPLLIAGKLPLPGEPWFTDPRPHISELGLQDHVRTLGFVPDADKPALYTLADLFLFPSRYEGFGLPPLEAMTCGTPALVSDSSSLPEIVGDTLTPVPAGDEISLAQAILSLLNHPPDPAMFIAQAAKFSWEDTAAKTAEVIRSQL